MARSVDLKPAKKRKRAAKGSGSVYERADRPGVWVAEVRTPKRVRKSFGSRMAAMKWLEAQTPGSAIGGKVTLAGWLDLWLIKPSRRVLDDSTISFYHQMADVWKATDLARKPIHSITPTDIEDQLDEWAQSKRYSRTTITHLRRVLGTSLNNAVRAKKLAVNPVPATTLPGRKQPNRVRQIHISERIVRDLSDSWLNDERRAAFELSLHTGLRPAELLGLTWADLSLRECVVSVRRAVKEKRVKGQPTVWSIGEPKTPESNRDVAFDATVRPILFKYRRRFGEKPDPHAYVFPNAAGDFPLLPPDLSKMFRKLVDKAQVSVQPGAKRSEFRLYDLRAIHASLLLAGGVDPVAVAVRLGHTDVVSTMRRYAGYVAERDRAAAQMARVWSASRVPTEKKDKRQPLPAGARVAKDEDLDPEWRARNERVRRLGGYDDLAGEWEDEAGA